MNPLNPFISSQFSIMQSFFEKLISISEFPILSLGALSVASENPSSNAKPKSYFIAASKLQERVTIHQHAIFPLLSSDPVLFSFFY